MQRLLGLQKFPNRETVLSSRRQNLEEFPEVFELNVHDEL